MANLTHGQYHTISATATGDLFITGYPDIAAEDCICFEANGQRYQSFGITDGSILYCARNTQVHDKDLVIVFEKNGQPTLYCFFEDENVCVDSEMRILHDRSKIYAKVLGAFNFYH